MFGILFFFKEWEGLESSFLFLVFFLMKGKSKKSSEFKSMSEEDEEVVLYRELSSDDAPKLKETRESIVSEILQKEEEYRSSIETLITVN